MQVEFLSYVLILSLGISDRFWRFWDYSLDFPQNLSNLISLRNIGFKMYQRIEESNCIWQRNVTDRLFSLCIESKKGPFFKRWLFPSRVLLWGLRNIFEAAALTSIFTYFLPSFFEAFCLNWGSKSVFSQRLKENFLELLFTELFNIPDWDCPVTVKAPFYQGL